MKEEFRRKLFEERDEAAEEAYIENRTRKARKIKAVLEDAGKASGELLDLGCSLGIIARLFKDDFRVTGIDPDEQAVEYAKHKWPGIDFEVKGGEDTGFSDGSFDVVICAGVYEHVSDPEKLLKEIHRVLKKGGVCYFTGMNRLIPIEPHYKLPFLSYLPKALADRYVRIKADHDYDVKSFCLTGLKKLVSDFEIVDYTRKVISDPGAFHAEDVVRPGSAGQKVAEFVSKYMYWAVPTYIWVLRKA